MVENALIDGDIVSYRCAAVAEDSDVAIALWQAGEMIQRILHETNAVGYRIYLTGPDNFRYLVYPEYKANRREASRPRHLEPVREYLVSHWNAKVTNGYEADDAMGVDQCQEENTVICSIDKDMLMIPGWHYNFVKQQRRYVTPLDGMRHFYYQMIMGDKSDNIFGYDGLARTKVPKFLSGVMAELFNLTTEQEMYDLVEAMYDSTERMHVNGKCLWIWRKEGDVWVPPDERMDGSSLASLHHLGTEGSEPEVPTEV